MNRGTYLLGALLALALGGLACLGFFSEVRGGGPRVGPAAVQPGVAQPTPNGASPQGALQAPARAASAPGSQAPGPGGVQGPVSAGDRQAETIAPRSTFAAIGSSAPARVAGVLQGPEGPVRGARVALEWREPEGGAVWVEDTQSDEDGAFALSTKRLKGALELEVRARGFAPFRAKVRRLVPGEARNLGTLRLAPGRVLDIDVTDAGGRPLKGAQVLISSIGKAGANAFQHRGVSGANGRVRIMDAPLGTLRVQASAEGNGSRVLIHEHDGSGRPLRVALLPERSLTIFVRSSTGAPIGGALVLLTASDQRHESYEATSDAEGLVHFRGLGSKLFDVRIVAKGYRTDTRRKLEAKSNKVTIEMLPWPCLRLRVQAPDGQALPAGTVARAIPNTTRAALLRDPSNPSSIASDPVVVGPQGRARLCDLRPGEYVVRVDAPGFATTLSDPIRIALDSELSLGTLTLQAGGSLTVTVRAQDSPRPLPSARVELHIARPSPAALVNDTPAFRAAILESTTTDSSGRARFDHLSPGEYFLLFRATGYQSRLSGPFRVTDAHETALDPVKLTPGSVLRGIVRRAGGSPLGQAVVVLRGAKADAPVQLATAEDGTFTSPPLPPGTWNLNVRSFGAHSRSTPIERTVVIKPGRDPEPLELIFAD